MKVYCNDCKYLQKECVYIMGGNCDKIIGIEDIPFRRENKYAGPLRTNESNNWIYYEKYIKPLSWYKKLFKKTNTNGNLSIAETNDSGGLSILW